MSRAVKGTTNEITATERHGEVVIAVPLPTTTYFDEILRLRCREELFENRLFPNAKELTESLAAARAALFDSGLDPRSPDVTAIVVGDGTTPRTAATLALRSRWRVLSVDPALRTDLLSSWRFPIRSLELRSRRIQNLDDKLAGHCIVVSVHAHVRLDRAVEAVRRCGGTVVAAVALPCCGRVHEAPGLRLISERVDWGIWSPERQVLVWSE